VTEEAPRRRFELLCPLGQLLSKQPPWPG